MASIKKEINAEALRAKGIPRKSWSKLEFCARNDLSEGAYRELQKRGLGPDETEVLDRILITVEAENKWLKKNLKRKDKAEKAKVTKAASDKPARTKSASIKAASAEA
ncbi:hypothetical protein ABID65_000360 [Bradyrhizobium sp. S3.9.2]|uniref:hypothetical protein n=1 Tax=Bradyrhizobium sp. S3.9.2 TaxID=3156432 RepID=UPI003397EEE0